MKAKEMMTKQTVSISCDSTIKQALMKLAEHRIGGLPVVDENGVLVNFITDGDIFRFLKPSLTFSIEFDQFFEQLKENQLAVKIEKEVDKTIREAIKERDILTIDPNDDADEIATLFARNVYKQIPVVDRNNTLRGIISRGDVIRYIADKI